MQQPDVSVLIVNYNVKDYLLQCLRSVYRHDGSVSVQIVVVDNASSDSSVEEVRPLFPDVVWIPLEENIGFGRGNNAGLEYCTGRHVLFLNPDTIVGDDTLGTMVRYLDAHPEVGLAGCKVLNSDGSFQVACRRGFPSPWVSFCRLFGLQSLFPSSPLFARYNVLYRSVDETYDVDALIGAFMIGPRTVIMRVEGFDPDYFMYGEDLDLCYRIQKLGYHIRYVHSTSIVHFKGESTRRSSMNEVRVFYQAMEIFARKHFGQSWLYLFLLRCGILLRSVVERVLRHRLVLGIAVVDAVLIVAALLLGTIIKEGEPFGFPEYAYPVVLFVVPAVALFSMMAMGEYVEHRPTIQRSVVGLLLGFFVLSSLTYFFKEYAFSRSVVLMTIGFSAVLLSAVRLALAVYDATRGATHMRRIVFVGQTPATAMMIGKLRTAEHRYADVVGIVTVGPFAGDTFAGSPILGSHARLGSIVQELHIQEVIVADDVLAKQDVMHLMTDSARAKARFHIASDYDDVVTARIMNDVAGIEPTVDTSPLLNFRNRLVKRAFDIMVASIMLLWKLPVRILGSKSGKDQYRRWAMVLRGRMSVIGLYPDRVRRAAGKEGITGLAFISRDGNLSVNAVHQLNDYYVARFTLSLDFEILLQHLLRRARGI